MVRILITYFVSIGHGISSNTLALNRYAVFPHMSDTAAPSDHHRAVSPPCAEDCDSSAGSIQQMTRNWTSTQGFDMSHRSAAYVPFDSLADDSSYPLICTELSVNATFNLLLSLPRSQHYISNTQWINTLVMVLSLWTVALS